MNDVVVFDKEDEERKPTYIEWLLENVAIEQAFLEADPKQDIVVHEYDCRTMVTSRYVDCDCTPLAHFVRGAKA